MPLRRNFAVKAQLTNPAGSNQNSIEGSKQSNAPDVDGRAEKFLVKEQIESSTSMLQKAAMTKKEDPDQVIEALLNLEKLQRKLNKLDDGATSRETLQKLNGSWRLIFTTGTADTQKKLGRKVNYFPIKAVQSFNTTDFSIENGVYLGDFSLIKFGGDFEWIEKPRRLEFDFDRISLLGLPAFNLPKGGAAEIGKSTGLGAERNVEMVKAGAKPFFNWISANDEIATARGGGGGLALWKRVTVDSL